MKRPWQSGAFDRARTGPLVRPFTPAHAVNSLEEVDLEALWARGKRLILLDVDNTLVAWKQENFSQEVIDWLERAKALGFHLCILSNTRRVARLMRIKERLGVDTVRGRFKPSRAMYRLALIKYKCRPEQAIMLGDQMMTDVLGANRAHIEAIWVRQMGHHEFGPTKINRFIERLLTGAVYSALITPMDERPGSPAAEAAKPPAQRTIVHQIIRFGMVGGAAFVVDFAVRFLLIRSPIPGPLGHDLRTNLPSFFGYAQSDEKAAAPLMFGIAALIAMTASFLMNRAWTFEVRGKEQRIKQAGRFYAVSICGSFINAGMSSFVYNELPNSTPARLLLCSMCGAAIAAVWNFLGSRYYAFRT
jgi:HAD superfamily phosphatase (TIGR01668 family)